MISLPPSAAFYLGTINRIWFNTTMLRRRAFDGHIVSMNQAGSHWLKFMLSNLLALHYDLPKPDHIQSDAIVGHPKSPPKYGDVPRIVHSHSLPHALLMSRALADYIDRPLYVVLVRDPRKSLISQYERFKEYYVDIDFDAFLRVHPAGKKVVTHGWSRIRFMNIWGDMAEKFPQSVQYVRYEDIQNNTESELKRIAGFLCSGVEFSDEHISKAIQDSTKDKMAQLENPDEKTTVVRTAHKDKVTDYFTPENATYFHNLCRKYLRHDFGYDLSIAA